MGIHVEPLEGSELDRLITALLNATGAVGQVIDREIGGGCAGLEVIGRSAERLRAILAVVAEHHGDEELEVITEFLAIATMLIAAEEGFADVFGPDAFRAGREHNDLSGLSGLDDFDDHDDPDDSGGLHADWV